jgi:hypothetical protein
MSTGMSQLRRVTQSGALSYVDYVAPKQSEHDPEPGGIALKFGHEGTEIQPTPSFIACLLFEARFAADA